jgi:hypothetical protein
MLAINAVNKKLTAGTKIAIPMNPARKRIFFTSFRRPGKRWMDGWASALFKRLMANEKLLV